MHFSNVRTFVMSKTIVMLVGQGKSASILFYGIKSEFPIHSVIVEQSRGIPEIIQKKIKRLGFINVIGQILFQLVCVKLLRIASKNRIEEIKSLHKLSDDNIDHHTVVKVDSVNSKTSLAVLNDINPDIILVCGTRIISKDILSQIDSKFINTHIGITPKYRGVHGGYWAVVNNDLDNLGVTIHFIDEGIDTGDILYQDKVAITQRDNFSTYVYLQYAKGIKLLKMAITDIMNDEVEIMHNNSDSKLYYHPTIWNYLQLRITKGIR